MACIGHTYAAKMCSRFLIHSQTFFDLDSAATEQYDALDITRLSV